MEVNAIVQELEAKLANGERIEIPQFPTESLEDLYALGYCHYDNGKYKEAENIFRYLTLVNAQAARNWMGLGAALQMSKQYESALEAYSYALLLDSDNPYVYIHAGDCYFGLDQIDQGLESMKYAKIIASRDAQYAGLLPQLTLIRKRWSKKNQQGV